MLVRRFLLMPAFAFSACLSIAGIASAQELDADGIREVISGKRVYLATPYGVELPLIYKSNGEVEGDVSGISLASMFTPRETGKWWVEGSSLCQQWPTWYDGKALCFTLRQTGENTLSWVRRDGLSGTARIAG